MSECENSCGGSGTDCALYCWMVVGLVSTPTLPTIASLRSTLKSCAIFGSEGCVANVRPPGLSGVRPTSDADGKARMPRLPAYALHSPGAVGMTTLWVSLPPYR